MNKHRAMNKNNVKIIKQLKQNTEWKRTAYNKNRKKTVFASWKIVNNEKEEVQKWASS